MLLSLKHTADPPTRTDLRNYFDLLLKHNLHELAYYTWLQFLPPRQLSKVGSLINGGFETNPSGLPFDWVIQAGSGVTAQLRNRPDEMGNRGLYVEFSTGRVQFGGVSQLLTLSPGMYQLKGKYKGEILGRRGLRWRVMCAAGDQLVAQTPMVVGAFPEWAEFELAVRIPDADCRAQKLQLVLDSRSASEQLVYGSIWYDELSVTRTGDLDDPKLWPWP